MVMESSSTGYLSLLKLHQGQNYDIRRELQAFEDFLKKVIPQLLQRQDINNNTTVPTTDATYSHKRDSMGKSRRHSRKLFRFFSCFSDKSGELSSDDILTSSPFPSSKTSSKECDKCSQYMVRFCLWFRSL